ncbi:uncharacterized protein GGS25DRAFT_503109 [Hypoxylon fragiforme]|uniref:uncharacterized protein n=1 Tax=Hypoxylon fragiforme TaxID=63214 RepID=UPI0020C5DAA4|nr:uncharacterized protein GGS25DRAFT_503109 [Hypoxylon fragiforme]KAI2605015.1 hypothetical protein GGS25DRAFT_503109 [Hypoxylon fragiforme]
MVEFWPPAYVGMDVCTYLISNVYSNKKRYITRNHPYMYMYGSTSRRVNLRLVECFRTNRINRHWYWCSFFIIVVPTSYKRAYLPSGYIPIIPLILEFSSMINFILASFT